MVHKHHHQLDDERREFLKALGVGGTVAVGSATLDDVRSAVTTSVTTDLATTGEQLRADLAGALNADLLATHQDQLTTHASTLPGVPDTGLPQHGPRTDFLAVAEATRPVYTHLINTGFFEATTTHLPEFTSDYLIDSVQAFVGSDRLAAPLQDLNLADGEGVDLVATVVGYADQLTHHWIPTDEITREHFTDIEYVPPMTQAAAGGVLLWLEDLDDHLWRNSQLLTEDILGDAAWYGHTMAAGLQLMTEGAKVIAEDDRSIGDDELTALLSTGFAVQTISQHLLPEDVYWVSDAMRGDRRTDLEVVSDQPHM